MPTIRAMLAALRRSRAPVWPFVDQRRSIGRRCLAREHGFDDDGACGHRTPSEADALTKPVTIAHNAAFPEIYEAFSTQGCLTMVVVADQRPDRLPHLQRIPLADRADQFGNICERRTAVGRFAQPARRLAGQRGRTRISDFESITSGRGRRRLRSATAAAFSSGRSSCIAVK